MANGEILTLRKAQRSKAFFKLGVSGPAGSGKTMGALLVAYGLLKETYPDLPDNEIWEKIAVVDTEHGSGELYVGTVVSNLRIGQYLVATLDEPFTLDKFMTAMDLCLKADVEVCILDSTSHLWAGSGGLLEQQQDEVRRVGNSYVAWRKITPQHDAFIDRILQTPMHVIATMRAKPQYVLDSESGKSIPRKVGMGYVQRKDIDFEFTTFFEIDLDHKAYVPKDRTNLFDQKTMMITPEVGAKMMRWLKSGTNADQVVVEQLHMANPEKSVANMKEELVKLIKEMGGSRNKQLMSIIKSEVKSGNVNAINDPEKLQKLKGQIQELKDAEVTGNTIENFDEALDEDEEDTPEDKNLDEALEEDLEKEKA